MNQKTPTSFLPFLALAAILCLASVVAVYFRFSLHPTSTPTLEVAPGATEVNQAESTEKNNAPSSSAGTAYPALNIPSAASTLAKPSGHGYPVPGSPSATRASGPKDVATEGTPSTPTYLNYFPVILDGKYQFGLQGTGVVATQGFSGCNWTGVAGQAFDLSGHELLNLIVHLEGTWSGKSVSQDAVTGGATEYGPAGYAFVLDTRLLATSNTLSVQLLDANHRALSLPISFSTYADCPHNLILVNFTQNY